MKSVFITGGNSGLGLETVKFLASTPDVGKIFFTYRSKDSRDAALEQIKKVDSNIEVHPLFLELSDVSSIFKISETLASSFTSKFEMVFLNAGAQQLVKDQRSDLGIEKTFATNHLGHFLLLDLLKGFLSENARIISTASGTHDPKQKTGLPAPTLDDIEHLAYPWKAKAFSEQSDRNAGLRYYATSKLCNIMFIYHLNRLVENDELKGFYKTQWFGAFDPGLMPGTSLPRNHNAFIKLIWPYIGPIAKTFYTKNTNKPSVSGQRLATLALTKFNNHPSGIYFEGEKPIRSSDLSYNELKQAELWNFSKELIKEKTGYECYIN